MDDCKKQFYEEKKKSMASKFEHNSQSSIPFSRLSASILLLIRVQIFSDNTLIQLSDFRKSFQLPAELQKCADKLTNFPPTIDRWKSKHNTCKIWKHD